MARIALIDASPGTAIAVAAACGAHVVVPCSGADLPPDIDLVVIDCPVDCLADTAAGAFVRSSLPVLLLMDSVPEQAGAKNLASNLSILKKRCDLLDLQQKIRALLDRSRVVPAVVASPW